MDSPNQVGKALDDIKVHVKLKLSAIWTSVMFCYVYGDYFLLYQPGKLEDIMKGNMAPLGQVTQGVLLFTSISMTMPAVMIFLTILLKANLSRWLNFIVGLLYTAFVLITLPGAGAFYLFLGSVDIVLTGLIVYYAWTWPSQGAA